MEMSDVNHLYSLEYRYNIFNISVDYIIKMFLRLIKRLDNAPPTVLPHEFSKSLTECAKCGSHISSNMTIERGWDLSFCSCYCRNKYGNW